MKRRAEEDRAYAREIERRWARLHERAVVLSPKDWALITDWQSRGVPLWVLDEAIQAAVERRAGREPPRSLAYLAPAVDESWSLVLEGRRREAPLPRPPAVDARQRWREVALVHASTPLGALLEGLLARLEGGEAPEAVDDELDHALSAAVEPERVASTEAIVEQELRPFADRMTPTTLAETTSAAVAMRLRRELGLPTLVG